MIAGTANDRHYGVVIATRRIAKVVNRDAEAPSQQPARLEHLASKRRLVDASQIRVGERVRTELPPLSNQLLDLTWPQAVRLLEGADLQVENAGPAIARQHRRRFGQLVVVAIVEGEHYRVARQPAPAPPSALDLGEGDRLVARSLQPADLVAELLRRDEQLGHTLAAIRRDHVVHQDRNRAAMWPPATRRAQRILALPLRA